MTQLPDFERDDRRRELAAASPKPTVDRSGVSSDDILVEDQSVEFADAKALRERGFKRINKPKRLTPPRP